METRTALVIGATGLVGSHLLRALLDDASFNHVVVFGRRASGVSHAKLVEYVVDFDDVAAWRHLVEGDVLFSALGTTRKQAGSQAAQWVVDYTYQLEVAKAAAANDVASFVLVSSIGASADSRIFYTRMKGQLDRDVAVLAFDSVQILRPGMLTGPRSRERRGEEIGRVLMKLLNRAGLFRAYRPVHADTVAAAMIVASRRAGHAIHEAEQVFELAARGRGR